MKPFQQRRDVQDACILWGSRVVIPPPGRPKLLKNYMQVIQALHG